MSLAAYDLNEIRRIIESALAHQTSEIVKLIQDELQALRNDIKEIYDKLSGIENKIMTDKQIEKLSLEEKLLKLNSDLLNAPKQAGISLPR